MKKRFGDPECREYFKTRPIEEEFLEYSARDVEDLVEVYEAMMEFDEECLSGFIGGLYNRAS
jgi:hypothetical protein